MVDLKVSQDLAAIAERFEKAEDALHTLLATGNGALEAKKELADARAELERAGAQARDEMAACRNEIAFQLDRTALEFREALEATINALTTRIERTEAAAAAVAESAHAALHRSQTAIDDVASQARQQSRALTDIARDLKDTADMLYSFRPDEITDRLDAITANGQVVARRLGVIVAMGLLLALAVFGAFTADHYWAPLFE